MRETISLTRNLPSYCGVGLAVPGPVPLLGKSLLERHIHTLREAGIDDIHIATGYLAEKIETLGFGTSFNSRFAETNMVESLFCAMDYIRQDGDLIIAYGDIVYERENLNAVLACNDEIALMIDAEKQKKITDFF